MTNIKAVDYLSQVRTVGEFEKVVSLVIARKNVIKSMFLMGYNMKEEIQELREQIHIVNNWIIDRLESGAYSGNDLVLDSLRENRTHLINSSKEMREWE
ncbi:hypothetical protein PQE71_gp008 [Bacillus phage Izhevsk]|uniref:Uncharacterized protein n=1 Tax=Bacillus phage Izhevsk TaxID=2724322 RepID=A0A6H0X5U3_9CAUD|nr:hypothetical protein PQE71_gp008 [Bacillus phage Izhevsk]QIW89690.1 hypothetical protein Izhevsk_8 [Bacillus phage Izhevsk]